MNEYVCKQAFLGGYTNFNWMLKFLLADFFPFSSPLENYHEILLIPLQRSSQSVAVVVIYNLFSRSCRTHAAAASPRSSLFD